MNILFTISSLEIGGAEIFLVRLSNYLAEKKGHRIYVLDFEPEKRDLSLISQFVPSVTLLNAPSLPPFSKRVFEKTALLLGKPSDAISIALYKSYFKKLVEKNKINIVHSHLHRSDRIVSQLDLKVPLLSTLHGCYNFYDAPQSEALFSCLAKFQKLIYITERNLEPIRKMRKASELLAKAQLIYNGIEITAPLPKKERPIEPLHLLVMSRCIEEKGWEVLIRAVKEVNSSGTLVKLSLVGGGEFLNYLIEQYSHLAYLKFEGMQAAPQSFVAESDVCCFPSLYANESLPNSILEYQLQGKPIISNDLGDIAHMMTLNESICGYLAPKNCSKEQLQKFFEDKIKSYLYDRTLLVAHGHLAIQCVKRFDLQICADGYMSVYEELNGNA